MFMAVLTGKKVLLGLSGTNHVRWKYAEREREGERESSSKHWTGKGKNDARAVKQEVQIERPSAPPRKVLESFIRKIFTYGV